MLRRGSCIGCFVFARKIRRFLVETANDKRILFFCLLDGVNLQAFYGFYFGFWGRNVQQPLKTHLFSKHNGQLDFLFRLTQVEIAAVGDGHAQLIEYAVRQLRHSRAGLVGDRPQLGGNLY